MEKLKVVATLCLAFGLMCFAGALAYFSYSIVYIVPKLSEDLSKIKGVIDPIIDETRAIRELVPTVLAESEAIRGEIDPILVEVKAVRETIPPIVEEWHATRSDSLPEVLKESQAIREKLPELLEESQAYRDLIDKGLVESQAYRDIVPTVLEESAQLRELIPPTLDRVENIVTESKSIASTAGEDAVTGFFTGVIKSPFKLASDLSRKVFRNENRLTASETEILNSTIEHVVNVGKVGATQTFQDPKSDFNGSVTVLTDSYKNGHACRDLEVSYQKGSQGGEKQTATVCLDPSGTWSIQ